MAWQRGWLLDRGVARSWLGLKAPSALEGPNSKPEFVKRDGDRLQSVMPLAGPDGEA